MYNNEKISLYGLYGISVLLNMVKGTKLYLEKNIVNDGKEYNVIINNGRVTIKCNDGRELRLDKYYNKVISTNDYNIAYTNIEYKLKNDGVFGINGEEYSWEHLNKEFECLTPFYKENFDSKQIDLLWNYYVKNGFNETKSGYLYNYKYKSYLISKDLKNVLEINNVHIPKSINSFNLEREIEEINKLLNDKTYEFSDITKEHLEDVIFKLKKENTVIKEINDNFKNVISKIKEIIEIKNNIENNIYDSIFKDEELYLIINNIKDDINAYKKEKDEENRIIEVKKLIKNIPKQKIEAIINEYNKKS